MKAAVLFTLQLLAEPLSIALLLMAVFVLFKGNRHKRTPLLAKLALYLGIVVLVAFSMPFTSNKLLGALESLHPPIAAAEAAELEALVLLGGGLSPPLRPRPNAQLLASGDRLLVSYGLWRAGKASRIIISGGGDSAGPDHLKNEAHYTKQILVSWGVPEQDILLEASSLTTNENAQHTASLLQAEKINTFHLVTSANHMPRAVALFRAQGLEPNPVPANHWIIKRPAEPLDFVPSATSLSGSTRAINEMAAMAYYLFQGRISLANITQ